LRQQSGRQFGESAMSEFGLVRRVWRVTSLASHIQNPQRYEVTRFCNPVLKLGRIPDYTRQHGIAILLSKTKD
jgi:hypothetical protein